MCVKIENNITITENWEFEKWENEQVPKKGDLCATLFNTIVFDVSKSSEVNLYALTHCKHVDSIWRCTNCYFSLNFPELSMNESSIRFPGLKEYSNYRHFSNYISITLSLTTINTHNRKMCLELSKQPVELIMQTR